MDDFSFEMFSRHCQFHPVKLKLACALGFGRVCVLSCPDPSTQLSQWQKKYLESTNKSDVWKIGWNVSEIFIMFLPIYSSSPFICENYAKSQYKLNLLNCYRKKEHELQPAATMGRL